MLDASRSELRLTSYAAQAKWKLDRTSQSTNAKSFSYTNDAQQAKQENVDSMIVWITLMCGNPKRISKNIFRKLS